MQEQTASHTRFGTFTGVFTPCLLMILGVILFLRLGLVTGHAGLLNTLLIIGLAKLITTLTALSLAGVATNTRVRGGGAYYLISRSLGVEYGGAIGPVFFLALAASVALYVVGFTEAVFWLLPEADLPFRVCASLVNLLVFASVYAGAGWTLKVQMLILAILCLSLVSFFAGTLPDVSVASLQDNLDPAYPPGVGFSTVFALFFPAVTGIMAGANLSGDLDDPGRSIPRGTLTAIAVTAFVYVGVAVTLAASHSRSDLQADTFILGNAARWPALVAAGVFAATLSSALSAMMGAPRVLQALARDGIFDPLAPFARVSGHNHEPRRAILFTFLIAQSAVMLGDLDTIAPLITMFFIITYGAINLSCFYESITGNPSFRPTFRFSHWSVGLAGAVVCAAAMLLIAPVWALASFVALGVLLRYVSRREITSRWGDVRWGNAYERARRALLRLEEATYHPKSWRPSILAVRGARWTNEYRVAEYACWLQGGRGIVTLAQVVEGEVDDRIRRRSIEQQRAREFIHDEHLDAFSAVVVDASVSEGLRTLLQSHGIGSVRPNTVLIEWNLDPAGASELADLVQVSRSFECSAVAVSANHALPRWETRTGTIDVWWHSRKNGALMLVFAHLITRSHAWRDRPIRLMHAVATEGERSELLPAFDELIARARVRATPDIIVTDDVSGAVERHSRQAALVLLGMDPPDGDDEAAGWHAEVGKLLEGLDEVILVSSAGDVRLGG